MIIVLEGPDGAGKTTLAKALLTRLGARGRYLHDRPVKNQFVRDTAQARQAVKNLARGLVTVLDRHWVGEGIYGPVFRPDKPSLGLRRLDSVLLRYGAAYIICAPPVEQLCAEFEQLRRARPEKFDTVRDVATRYLDLWHGSVIRPPDGNYVEQQSTLYPWFSTRGRMAFHYDRFTDGQQLSRFIGQVLQDGNAWHKAARAADPLAAHVHTDPWDAADWELSGSLLTCRALLVGERAKEAHRSVNWPFFWPCQSAGYLSAALHKAKVNELDVALTNALRARDGSTEPLRKIMHWLRDNRPDVKVIPLGKVANAEVEKIAHQYIPVEYSFDALSHPQWARRFDHHGDYHKQLERAIYG